MDLEYVLGVIADGPSKSFAFRRLNYLTSKFTMYSLLNETQELVDMKVRLAIFHCACPLLTCAIPERASSVCDLYYQSCRSSPPSIVTSTTSARSIPMSTIRVA